MSSSFEKAQAARAAKLTTTFADVLHARANLSTIEHDYLTRYGWTHTSNNPGSLWLWVRDFAKEDAERLAQWKLLRYPTKPEPWGFVKCDQSTAVAITQRALEHDPADDEPA